MPKIYILVANNMDFEFLVSMAFYYLFCTSTRGMLVGWLVVVLLSTLVNYSRGGGRVSTAVILVIFLRCKADMAEALVTALQKRLFGMAHCPQRKNNFEGSAQFYILCIDLGHLHDLAEEVSC